MASDLAIIEEELTKQKGELKRTLHMKKVRSLARKQYGLAKLVRQRRLVKVLDDRIDELQSTVSMLYNPNSLLKDHELKGYLVYLLNLRDHFACEVKTKEDILREREDMIKKLIVKVTSMRNEYAKKRKHVPRKPVEYILLENMSNRLNQIEIRICTVQHQNKEIREKILDMRTFQRLYKGFERDRRLRIKQQTEEIQKRLDSAVTSYENRDDLMNKIELYKERCAQDLKKAAANQTLLDIIDEKVGAFDEMVELQNQGRSDSRVALTAELIEQGVTGLEPTLKQVHHLHSAIVKSSGKVNPEDMEENFKLVDDVSSSVFSYLDDLLKGIHHTQDMVDELKKSNTSLLKSLSTEARKLSWEIGENIKKVESLSTTTELAVQNHKAARLELDNVYQKLTFLHILCDSDPEQILQKTQSKAPLSPAAEKRKSKIDDIQKKPSESEKEDDKRTKSEVEVTETVEEEVTRTIDKLTEEVSKTLSNIENVTVLKTEATEIVTQKEGVVLHDEYEKDVEEDGTIHTITASFEESCLNSYTGKNINDYNVYEFLEDIEKNILEYLMLVEYLRIKDLPVDDTPIKLKEDELEMEILEKPQADPLDTLLPRPLWSRADLPPMVDAEKFKVTSGLKELKSEAVSVISEMESNVMRKDEPDETYAIEE